METDEVDDDPEDIIKDVRENILSKHLGEEVDEDDANSIPFPVTREDILEKQRYDELCRSVMAKDTTRRAPIFQR